MKAAQILALACASALLGATNALPISRLSLAERLSTAPDATVIQAGSRTMTLSALRAQHRAREAFRASVVSLGTVAGKNLQTQKPVVLRSGTVLSAGQRIGSLQVTSTVVEPPANYASAPADMKAFCAGAQASACMYLPPGQTLQLLNGYIIDTDPLIDASQCAQEGGQFASQYGWGSAVCSFAYPGSVVVHFTPAANYQISSSANCDKTFTYQVDTHGAIGIQLADQSGQPFSTIASATCVVRVMLGV